MKPPYSIDSVILHLISSISEKIGEVKASKLHKTPAHLRKENRIKTIQSTLEIEGNSLSKDQVTAIINQRRVLAPEKDILEVQNVVYLYEHFGDFNPYEMNSFLAAHKQLMKGLIEKPGAYRTSSVGILKGYKLSHLAPSDTMVYPLMKNLFTYLKKDEDHLLIRSCVFHYEMEFIHPFSDGNGRMGRLWQSLILKNYSPVFEYLPVESLVKENQKDYYGALEQSDNLGDSSPFIKFMLRMIDQALEEVLLGQNYSLSSHDRLELFREQIQNKEFSRKDYLRHNKNISAATASRDLREGVEKGVLRKEGEMRLTRYAFT